jgi:EmrB/QacA subfamily drug resistance transporter
MARRGTLPTVLTGVFVAILDFFIVNVAIPTTQRDLHAGSTAVEWTVAGYGLAYGAGLILGGRLGDAFGRRRMFATGLAAFTLASAGCGFAPTVAVLIAARVAQGAAAALLTPQVLAILRTTWSGAAQRRVISAYALTMGLAAVFGQLVGGLLIRADLFGLGWRACFLINLPIGAAALAAVRRTVPESRVEGAGSRLDPAGAALVTAALVALLLPLVEGREQGWPLWTWLSFAGCAVLVGGYLRYARGRRAPIIDPELLRDRAVGAGLLTSLSFSMGMAAYFLVFALWTQQGRGLDALGAGLLFTPIGLGYLAGSALAPRAAARLGRQGIALGALLRAASLAALAGLVGLDGGHTSLGWFVPLLCLDGLGMGLAFSPITATVLARVEPRHAGGAAGVLATSQQVGGAIGVGIVGIVYYGALGSGPGTAFQHAACYLVGATLAVAAAVQLVPRAPRTAVTPAAPAAAPAVPAPRTPTGV